MKNKNWRSVGWCNVHNKHLYESRAVAKRVCRQHQGEHKSPFPCDAFEYSDAGDVIKLHPGLWHIGGLRSSVIHGRVGRDDVYRNAA